MGIIIVIVIFSVNKELVVRGAHAFDGLAGSTLSVQNERCFCRELDRRSRRTGILTTEIQSQILATVSNIISSLIGAIVILRIKKDIAIIERPWAGLVPQLMDTIRPPRPASPRVESSVRLTKFDGEETLVANKEFGRGEKDCGVTVCIASRFRVYFLIAMSPTEEGQVYRAASLGLEKSVVSLRPLCQAVFK